MSGASDPAARDTARLLSDFAAGLSFERLPPEAVETTRIYIADYYAACFAGIRVNAAFNQALLPIVEGMGGKEEASVFGSGRRFPAENAAFMNGVYAHGADMDDGNRKAMGHVAAHVMSAVFAMAETLGKATWQDVFTAINVGYEVYNRVAAAAQPGLVHRGFHSTGTAGALACAAACAKLMGLDADGIYHAIAISAIQASGLIIIAESGQACKPLNPANAAKTGILSARLAAAGVKGPVLPLESQKGWFHAMTDEVHDEMLDGLGETFTICESYLKPYPSCRHTHCGIEAAIGVREELLRDRATIGDIRDIRLFIYENAIRIAGQIKQPETPDDAKFSIHYSLATALATGNYTLEDLEKAPGPEVIGLIEKTELIPDAAMEDRALGIRGCRLEVTLADGRRYEKTVLLPKGDATNPFSWEDMQRKMEACLHGAGSGYSVGDIIGRLRSLELSGRFHGIFELLG